MKYVDELGIYVSKVEDLRDKVSSDLYDAIEYLINENTEIITVKDNYNSLREEFDAYESMNEDLRDLMVTVLNQLKASEDKINHMLEYIQDTKRINRYKLERLISEVNIKDAIYDINMRI